MKFCPHCGQDISKFLAASAGVPLPGPAAQPLAPAKYDQVPFWKNLVARTRKLVEEKKPPTLQGLVDPVVASLMRTPLNPDGVETIVHLVFDRPIVPNGGVLMHSMMLDGRSSYGPEQLKNMGYLVIDGKVVVVDGSPVSPAYGVIDYWGGDKQFKRWHLARQVQINPSRNGTPFFMDEEMVAFGAIWRDMLKVQEALLSLLHTFTMGVQGDGAIAQPFALEVVPIT
jgi:hypothetical protein